MVGVFGSMCVDFLPHGVVSVAVSRGVDIVGVCANNIITVDVNGEPVLAVCMFGDSVFHIIWDEDSAFCFGVGVVSVVLGSLHVSGIPVLGFLDQDYGMFAEFEG